MEPFVGYVRSEGRGFGMGGMRARWWWWEFLGKRTSVEVGGKGIAWGTGNVVKSKKGFWATTDKEGQRRTCLGYITSLRKHIQATTTNRGKSCSQNVSDKGQFDKILELTHN